MKLAFIGLGRMGSGIARNLLKAGHELTVYNRDSAKSAQLKNEGATVALSPANAAEGSDAAFTMLSDDAAAMEVAFGQHGLFETLPKGATHLSLSTIGIATAKELAKRHDDRGQTYLSTPVFGRPEAAAAAKLLVIAAGPAPLIEKFHPVLAAIGRQTYIAGPEPWHANLLKLCGNFMIASMMETFGEAFATMRKAGMDHHLFHEVMSELFGSPVYRNYGGAIANQTFEPAGFALKLGLKDVRLALEAAFELQAPMPFASILRDHFISAIANGQEELDWSSVGLVPARMAGLKEK